VNLVWDVDRGITQERPSDAPPEVAELAVATAVGLDTTGRLVE
jgi:hypothetical protein